MKLIHRFLLTVFFFRSVFFFLSAFFDLTAKGADRAANAGVRDLPYHALPPAPPARSALPPAVLVNEQVDVLIPADDRQGHRVVHVGDVVPDPGVELVHGSDREDLTAGLGPGQARGDTDLRLETLVAG